MEEIRLDITPYISDLKLISSRQEKYVFCDEYFLKLGVDINLLKLQKKEVVDVKWFTQEEISNLISNNEYHNTHINMYNDCLHYLKNKR